MDLRDIEQAAEEQGWRIGRTSKGHHVLYAPDVGKGFVVFSGTPGDRKAIHHSLAQLKRRGFIWPWPPKGKRK